MGNSLKEGMAFGKYMTGEVSDSKTGYAKVFFKADNFVSDWLQICHPFTVGDKMLFPVLKVGTQVCCLMDENCEDGVIIGATYNDLDAPPTDADFEIEFEDGTKLTYDKTAHALIADVQGTAKIKALVTATVEAPMINLKGNVTVLGVISAGGISLAPVAGPSGMTDGKVTGDLKVTGNVEADTDVKVGSITLKNHHHTFAGGGGTTSAPIV